MSILKPPVVPPPKTAKARRAAELLALEPRIRELVDRLAYGAKTKNALDELGMKWSDFSRFGRVVTDRLKSASELGAVWRQLIRDYDQHQKAMRGNNRVLLRLWTQDQVREGAHGAGTHRTEVRL